MEEPIEQKSSIEIDSGPVLRVLQAEDDVSIRMPVGRFFDLEKIEHVACSTAMQAEEVFEAENHNFNVLLTDYDMPGMKGSELIVALKKKKPELMSILLSGRAEGDEQVRKELGETNYDYYLTKPITFETLNNILQKIKTKLKEKESEELV